MTKMKNLLKAGAYLGVLGGVVMASSPAAAVPVTIAGITFGGTGTNAFTHTIWENPVGAIGDTLTGIGRVDTIDSPDCLNFRSLGSTICWQNGDNGRELTFDFSYKLGDIVPAVPNLGPGTHLATAYFTGGAVSYYSDSTPDLVTDQGQPTDFTSATNGSLWLSVTGGDTEIPCPNACGAVTLFSQFFYHNSSFANILAAPPATGTGALEVVPGGAGGPAGPYFNTDTVLGDTLTHDFSLTTGFHTNPDFATGKNDFAIIGGAFQDGDTRTPTVPEPGTLLLLGTGLLALGRSRRRRQSA